MPVHGTSERLRHKIDGGRTRDKVDFPDPAAVPLGADEEAAGTPLGGPSVRTALLQETRRSSKRVAISHPPSMAIWFYAAFIVFLAVGMVAAMMLA